MPLEIWPGRPTPRGATFNGAGVNFAVYSGVATRVEVCLFDPLDPLREVGRFDLPVETDFVWHGYVPGLKPGTLYGLRVHGPYDPDQGHRCNPAKLLVDPYARAVHMEVDWRAPVHGYLPGGGDDRRRDERDSAPGAPRSVVVEDRFDWRGDERLQTPWRRTVIYEAHVRGLTMLHPEVPEPLRGTYLGLACAPVIEHLRRLGVTAVELLPVHEAADESFLDAKGLSNYWGYNTLAFLAAEQRYASSKAPGAAVSEFKQMVRALHAAGIEVILDVVYNHTCEGNHLGPTLSLRGVDNQAYYWLQDDRRLYRDFTGVGNSLNASLPQTARLITDSLRYWATEMRVDGFRFDLATTLGRTAAGEFDPQAVLFQIVQQDPVLSQMKLIAEPWDVGPNGYQVGRFPAPFREWNGKYRDAIRRFWKGDESQASEVGYRLTGSSDLYERSGRRPHASVNFITCHDGFTLRDLVSYGQKHNEANGERNRDGSDDNQSWNCGVEGETDDPAILRMRERQIRNLLATLFLSQGVPMITAGDELGRTQRGNNNAYCQDNHLSWISWELDDRGRALLEFVRDLTQLRSAQQVLQRRTFFRGSHVWDSEFKDIAWYRPDGTEMSAEDWAQPFARSLAFLLGGDSISTPDERGHRVMGDAVLVMLNAHHQPMEFAFPQGQRAEWRCVLFTDDQPPKPVPSGVQLLERSIAAFTQPPG